MTKEKKKKSDAGGKKDKKAKAKNPEAKAQAKAAKGAKTSAKDASPVADAVRTAKRKAADLASNPAVAEVVAATLVAAAAALRNPEKARELASSAREELTAAGKAGAGQGGALWQLALDVARRSVETLGSDAGGSKDKRKRKSDQ